MDLLSRLIAGSAATSPTKQKLNTPAERITACKRICSNLQATWRSGTKLSNDNNASGHVANLLNRLNTILVDESRKAAPHSCLLHTTSAQIYIIVAKLALSSDNPDVIRAARQFFHILINGEADGVLDSKIFARSLVDLVRRSTLTANIVVDEQGEAELVELLFEVATKIRLDPDILPAWFYPERDQSRSRVQGAEAKRHQFPLFYQLVEYVHHDGPMGDFARTGLLYLTDMASKSKPLEKWMIESDLAPQMASGLSALYSRLSRQVHVLTQDEKALPIIAFSDVVPVQVQLDETPEEFQKNVKAFLSYLAFWQDTLNHCKSDEVKDTLMDHFQVLFVQQLLYPSLLESSDVAGGSTSAVILHLYRMLEALDNPDMASRMLQYLLATGERRDVESQPGHRRGRVSISRRKSMEYLASMAQLANTPSPNLFNLLDMLSISLHSRHPQTINASLKLVTVILRRHHHQVLKSFFLTQPLAETETTRSLSKFDQTMYRLFELSSSIAQVDTADESYQAALNDAQILLQRHSCMLNRRETAAVVQSTGWQLTISADCKLFEAIVGLLGSFFANDSVTNITLTETIVTLASCEHIDLQDWVVNNDKDGLGKPRLTILTLFEDLTKQLEQWQSRFNEWNALFSYQRSRLAGVDDEFDRVGMRSSSPTPRKLDVSRTSSPRANQRPSTPSRKSTNPGKLDTPSTFRSIDGTLARSPRLIPSSPKVKAVATSPLHQSLFPREIGETTTVSTNSTSLSHASLAQLQQHVTMPTSLEEEAISPVSPQFTKQLQAQEGGSGTSTPRMSEFSSGVITPSIQDENGIRESATLSHVMTNAIILQEFVLEIAALIQVRATLFDEVELK